VRRRVRRVLWQAGVLASFGAIAYVGFAIVETIGRRIPRLPLTGTEGFLLFLAVVASAHIVLFIHETGHVLGGWLVGYRFRLFVVGPIRIAREADRVRVGFNRDIRRYGGFVAMEPGRRTGTVLRTALVVAAGPTSSLLAGIAFTLVALGEPSVREVDFGGFLLHRQLEIIGPGSIVVGLANLVPVAFSGGRSDGARLLELLMDSR